MAIEGAVVMPHFYIASSFQIFYSFFDIPDAVIVINFLCELEQKYINNVVSTAQKNSGFISRECSLTQLIEFEYFNIAVYLFAKVRTVLSEAFPSSSVCNNSYRARKKHYIYLCEEDTWLMWG